MRRTWAAAAAAAVVAGGGFAVAAIPSTDGKINGCVSADGALRVVDPDASKSALRRRCLRNERSIAWNERGPKGDPGPAGSQGGGAVVARTRLSEPGTASMTDPRNPTYGAAAVSGGNWTQATGEFDQLWGLASWAAPAADACTTVRHGYEDAGWGVVRVKLDGVVVAQDIQQAGTTRAAFPLTWGRLDSTVPEAVTLIPPVIGPLMSWALFEPAAATPHSFTAEFGDTCGLGGGKADAHFRLTDLEIDVVAAR